MRMTKRGSMVGILLAMMLVCASQAQVIQQVPAEAMVVLKVNNLKATSDKIAKLAQDLGLAAMAPPLADPLGFLQAEGKMQQGLNVNGDFAFVMLDPATVGNDPEQAGMFLIPVADYKAFLSNFPDAKTEGDVTQATIGTNPKPNFIANWGAYAVVAMNKDLVSKKPAAVLNVPAISSKEMSSKDIVVFANLPVVRAKLLPPLQQHRESLLTEVEGAMKNNPQTARYAPVIKALVAQLFTVGEGVLTQTQGATFGISIVPEGINSTFVAEFAPGTYAANMMTGEKNLDTSMLTGLPTAQYLIFGGLTSDPAIRSKAVGDFLNPIEKELAAVGPDMKPVQDYLDALKAN